jgi:hypothetical protein
MPDTTPLDQGPFSIRQDTGWRAIGFTTPLPGPLRSGLDGSTTTWVTGPVSPSRGRKREGAGASPPRLCAGQAPRLSA